jgi:ATP-dependent protease Clp ATPase subunit
MQGMMFCILALGWYLRKSGMIDKSGKALLSSLVMNVTLPASIVKSFQMEFSMDILKLTLEVIVISFLIQIFSNLLSRVTNEDLRAFGMIPEFLGRLPVNVTLKGLDKDMMIRILKEPKNAILRQYEKLLALDEVKLVFEEDALSWIAEEALKRGTGARALRAILEEFMLDIMYEIPKDPNIGSVVVTRPYLEKKGGPLIQVREG